MQSEGRGNSKHTPLCQDHREAPCLSQHSDAATRPEETVLGGQRNATKDVRKRKWVLERESLQKKEGSRQTMMTCTFQNPGGVAGAAFSFLLFPSCSEIPSPAETNTGLATANKIYGEREQAQKQEQGRRRDKPSGAIRGGFPVQRKESQGLFRCWVRLGWRNKGKQQTRMLRGLKIATIKLL